MPDSENERPPMVVQKDNRGRVSLARAGAKPHSFYFVEVDEDGVITLTPAVVVPASLIPRGASDE